MMVELGLGQGKATVFLDGGQAQRPIASRSREDDAYGVVALILGEGLEEGVDGPTTIPRRRGPGDLEIASLDRQGAVWWNDEDAVGLDLHAVDRLDHAHGGRFAEQFAQHALVIRRQVLDQHERHAGVGRRGAKKALEGLEATGRRADANDQQDVRLAVVRAPRCLFIHPFLGWRLARTDRFYCHYLAAPGSSCAPCASKGQTTNRRPPGRKVFFYSSRFGATLATDSLQSR